MSKQQTRIIELPKVADPRGNLTFIEGQNQIPFEVKRVYYIYDVPGGSLRGGHAHKEDQELLIAVAGSFRVTVSEGRETQQYTLNRAYEGLYLPPMVWRELDDFSTGSVCLVLSSNPYRESDYYRDYQLYQKATGHDE